MDEQLIIEMVKDYCSVEQDELAYNVELLILINSAVTELSDVGVTEYENFEVTSATEFPTFESIEIKNLSNGYLALKVREGFDPSVNATVTQSSKDVLGELEFRIMSRYEGGTDD